MMYEKTDEDITPTESLTFLENHLAYGLNKKKIDMDGSYDINLVGSGLFAHAPLLIQKVYDFS